MKGNAGFRRNQTFLEKKSQLSTSKTRRTSEEEGKKNRNHAVQGKIQEKDEVAARYVRGVELAYNTLTLSASTPPWGKEIGWFRNNLGFTERRREKKERGGDMGVPIWEKS